MESPQGISNRENILEKYYNKGYRTVAKLYDKLKQKGYELRKADAQKYVDSRKVKSRVKRYNKSLMGNKFSALLDTWQVDTYTTAKYKTDYLIAINVNTRYAWCKKRKSKNATELKNCLQDFIREMHPKVIEGDNEFSAATLIPFFHDNGIVVKIYQGVQGHEPLSIINKFCRTLRMESRDYDYDPPIPQIIKLYNKSYHTSIEMEPREMQNNRSNEYRYIYNQLAIRDEKEKLALKDTINKGDKVRYIRDEDRGSSKFDKDIMKYQLSKYYYIVEYKHSEFSYDIVAADGSTKTVPRYKLYKLTPTEGKVLSYAPTMEDASDNEIFDEIIDYNPVIYQRGDKKGQLNTNNTKYTVRIITRDSSGKKNKHEYEYTINQIRTSIPTEATTLELEFYQKHKDKYYIDKKTGFLMPK